MIDKNLLVFASGSANGGGSGFDQLALNAQPGGILDAKIVGVVSNHQNGGVKKYADEHGIDFFCLDQGFTSENYRWVMDSFGATWVALSGWLKLVQGLNPKRTFNIHPGPLPRFGGKGLYGHHVHEAVLAAFKRGEITHTAVTMHFVTEEYDQGPIFFEYPIPIEADDDADSIGTKVNKVEHVLQSWITNLVVNGEIGWDGKDPKTVYYPDDFSFKPRLNYT